MKKIYFFFVASCLSLTLSAATQELDPAQVLADTMYSVSDYTVPSYIQFLVAKNAAVADPTQKNLQELVDKVAALQSKENPYCLVATINGDPSSRMGFCWFTNDSVFDGEVQLVAVENATEADFEQDVIHVSATTKRIKNLVYPGICTYIRNATGLAKKQKFVYINHKALAENLTPGTAYSWRVGYDGHWSEIGHFRTEDVNQGELLLMPAVAR